jgi:thymidylate synthase (FAD)
LTKLKAKLIGLTQPVIGVAASTPENLISYCARVSNPANQENFDTEKKLFQYCMKNSHWSVFEMVNAVVEVEAPRDISRQLLRHRSFSFQEFSQRYSDEIEFTTRDFRLQDTKNRQNSLDGLSSEDKEKYVQDLEGIIREVSAEYKNFRHEGVAKECARVILPEGLTMSRLYVNGTLRSWLHYLNVRDDPGVTQWEHVLLARAIRKELEPVFPNIMVPKE